MMRTHPKGVLDYETIYGSFIGAGYQEVARDENVIVFEKQ